MKPYHPPFSLTSSILSRTIEIGELLGQWSSNAQRTSPLLRKENRIRTIQASLAIEHNSLSAQQVTAIMEGKRVLAPAKDIQEVRNAILAYEALSGWQSGNVDNLLSAHRVLMLGLVDIPGQLRSGDVGVYREGRLIHMAPPASQVGRLMNQLCDWLHGTDLHPLVASSVFHYEFEFIHPFSDGNGRMGRLWQTLILSEWRAELAWLPVETLIHDRQEAYYRVLRECDRQSDCTAFVEFMLDMLKIALQEGVAHSRLEEEPAPFFARRLSATAGQILNLIVAEPSITIARLAEATGLTSRTIERNLKTLQQDGRLERIGAARNGYWLAK
ncbi:Fic family protein [Cedecea sp. S5-13]|jgi:Fic family protein|uniref:Fic family protein n=1 Tax=Cedecea selenatireducens TaxID=3144416 RepID=UPI0035CCD87E